MDIRTKVGLGALALALSCAPMIAQDAPQGPPPGPERGEMQGGGPRGPMGRGEMRGKWAHERGEHGRHFSLARLLSDPEIQQKVGITADQVAKIRQEESSFRKTEIRQRADIAVQRIDLRDLMAAQTPDRAAIDAKLQQISAAQLAMEKVQVDFRLNMKQALTPEQREKLRQALRERWQAHRGTREGRPNAGMDQGHDQPGAGEPGAPPPMEPGAGEQ